MKLNKSNILAALLSYLVLGNCAVEAAKMPTCAEDRNATARLTYGCMEEIGRYFDDQNDYINFEKCKNFFKNVTARLDRQSMFMVYRVLDTIRDCGNVEKCCKNHNGISEEFKYNPIIFKTQKESELFKNMGIYHVHGDEDVPDYIKDQIKNGKIKTIIRWDAPYSLWKKNEAYGCEVIYKGIKYRKEDREKYLSSKNPVVELEEGITFIENECFSGCSWLEEIKIPKSVNYIGNHCFYECHNLRKINIPDGITFIGHYCFFNCRTLEEIEIPNSVSFIGNSSFMMCMALSKINIPDNVWGIGECSFYGCYTLNTINIPSNVFYIGPDCFGCSLGSFDPLKTITIKKDPKGGNQAIIDVLKKENPCKITVIEMK